MKNKTKGILNVALGAVSKNGKLLLIRRKKEPHVGYWGLTGGKIKFGEHYENSIVRELEEETGLNVKFKALRGVVEEFLSSNKKVNAHFFLFICETEYLGGAIKESEEGKLKWFTFDEIISNRNKIIPSDYMMIREFFSGKKRKVKIHKSKLAENGNRYDLEFFGI